MAPVAQLSELDFKYSTSVQAQNARRVYGGNYSKYKASFTNSVMTNPLKENHEKYVEEKRIAYEEAKAQASAKRGKWARYSTSYQANLAQALASNNGAALSGTQKFDILKGMGSGAVTAKADYDEALKEEEFALSLYNDAAHHGMWMS